MPDIWMDQQGVRHTGPTSPGAELVSRGNMGIPTLTAGPSGVYPGNPGTTNAAGVYTPLDPNGTATDMSANLLASEYSNWETQFKPIELNLLQQSSVENPAVLDRAVGDATTAANQSYDAMAGVQQRQMAARGIAPTVDQTAVQGRLTGLSRAASVAGARNQARQNVATQDDLIAWGSAPNPNVVQGSALSKFQ